jgi:hypothetical protein
MRPVRNTSSGMSYRMMRGPIFGFRITPERRAVYWVVAMQSSWLEKSRIIFGCPVPVFARMVDAALNAADESNVPSADAVPRNDDQESQ